MAIEITTGGVTKSYRYFPSDAIYVDANGSVNTSGNGRQVKEAYFDSVKYYPETSGKNVKDDTYSGGYVAKLRGDLVLTGYQPPVEDERGFMRTPGVSSYLRFVCTIIYQCRGEILRIALTNPHSMPDEHDDFPEYEYPFLNVAPGGYRFDGITSPAGTEVLLADSSMRYDIEFDIALSGPQPFNPTYGYWKTSTGSHRCAANFDYDIGGPVMHEVLSSVPDGYLGSMDDPYYYIHPTIQKYYQGYNYNYFYLTMFYMNTVYHPNVTTQNGTSLGVSDDTGPAFQFREFIPQTIEYVGPVSEAPESAFVLD